MIESEISILLQLNHPNIIAMKECYETVDHIYLVLEYVSGGELFERIIERGHYSETEAALAVRQILNALQYLHAHNVVHRDLKPENLLYADSSEDSVLKLADFGLSKILDDTDRCMQTVCGTVGYCAPEILSQEIYDSAVDLWSLGVILYILLSGYEPFWDEAGDPAIIRRIVNADYSFDTSEWEFISDSGKDLVRRLLVRDPVQRLTANLALEHPWVKGITTRSVHIDKTVTKLRQFNARRKFKAATHAVLATQRAMNHLSSPEKRSSSATSHEAMSID